MFHVKQRRFLGLFAAIGLSAAVLSGCISDESRGWGAPVLTDDTQVISARKGKLDGIDVRPDLVPAWTGTLSFPLGENDERVQSATIAPTDTVFQGDILRIGSEVVRVRSLTINGSEREMHLDRGFAGTIATTHPAGTQVEAARRAWRFPDDWHIREGRARNLSGVYGTPILGEDGVMYVGDYSGWIYAFRPDEVNRDAANDDQEPKVALADTDGAIIGGIILDEESGRLFATSGDRLVAVSTERLRNALAAGGGTVQPETAFNFVAGDDIWADPAIEDGVIYVASLDGRLYAVDAATGNVNWSFQSAKGLTTMPVVANDVVLVAGFDAKMFAVNKADGSLAWEYAVSNWILSSPAVEDGTVYVGDFDGILHAVNADSGAREWSIALNRGKIRGAPAVSGDFVVVGTDAGWLVGVNHGTQQRAWEVELGSDIHADLVPNGDEVLIGPKGCVTLPGGQVSVYYRSVEASSGTLRRVEGVC